MGWAIKIVKSGGQRDGDMAQYLTVDDDVIDFPALLQANGGLQVKKVELIRTNPGDAARLLFEKAEGSGR